MAAHCPKCGVELPADPARSRDLNFCPSCGHALHGFPTATDEVLEKDIAELLQAGAYIQAIKRQREATGDGLKAAIDRVDAVARKLGIATAPAVSGKSRFYTYLGVSAFLALMICSAGMAIFPPIGYVAKPFLCGGDLGYQSERLHRLPGQAGNVVGVNRSFSCPDGKDVTCFTLLISWPIYTVLLLLILYVRRLFTRPRDDRPGPTG